MSLVDFGVRNIIMTTVLSGAYVLHSTWKAVINSTTSSQNWLIYSTLGTVPWAEIAPNEIIDAFPIICIYHSLYYIQWMCIVTPRYGSVSYLDRQFCSSGEQYPTSYYWNDNLANINN